MNKKQNKEQKFENQEVNDNSINSGQEDIVFMEENVNDTQVVKKLRDRLRVCEKDKKEYLDGWQRAKADLLNNKKEASERLEKISESGKETLASELLPVLDSFDMAFMGEAWSKVDDVWQKGVEHIHTQLLSVLSAHGVEQFGKAGDTFDINLHEAVDSKEDSTVKSNTVLEILQAGYKTKNSIIRPARVIVAK